MLRKVRIKSVPQARTGYQVNGSLANDVAAWGGADYNSYIGEPQMQVKKSLTRVPREEANLEAEGGETAVVNTGDIPAFYDIKGPRHTAGGVPLALPDDSFIFSDTASMKITDPKILKMFSVKPKKGGYTPAELSKKYEINDYRKILQDPESDSLDKKTAELMIKNAVMKLGALALAQEAKKGFPQSVPEIAKPYMEASGITEEDLMPELAKKKRELEQQMAQMQQMQQGQQEMQQGAPEMMPNGAPVAMPQEMPQMPPEMMQQAPMAAYGMEMGGYDFPYENMPNAMAYGGRPKPIQSYQKGGGKTEDNLTEEDKKIIDSKWNGNKKAYIDYVNSKAGITSNTKLVDAMYEQYKKDIANKSSYTQGKQNEQLYSGYQPELAKLTKEQMVEQLLAQEERNARLSAYGLDPAKTTQRISQSNKGSRTNDEALALIKKTPGLSDLDFSGGYKGQAAYIAYRNTLNQPEYKQHGQFQTGVGDETVGGVKGAITGIDNANTNTTLGQRLNYVSPDEEPDGESVEERTCTCADGSSRILKEGEECDCPDGEEGEEDVIPASPDRKRSGPWLQDVIDVTGAASDYMGINKYEPTLVSPSLVKPDFVSFDPSRAYAGVGEQGYLAAMAAGQFAGPQNVSSATGQGYEALANIGSQYDNMNQAAGQQYEYNTNAIENQERGMKAGAIGNYLDQSAVVNQQYDDARTKGKFNMRQGAKNLLTNMAQTDAMNQMYPNYQTDPTSGGFVNFTPTDKTLDTTAQEDALAYAYKLKGSGLDPQLQKLMLEQKLGVASSAKGGTTFRKGGYIYTVFPAVTM